MPTDPTPPPPVSAPRDPKVRRYRIVATGLFFVGLLFSLLIWHFTRLAVHHTEKARFDHYAEMIRELLSERVDAHTAALRGMRAFIDASERVTRDEWQRYIDELDVGQQFKGAIGFSFIRYVRRDRLESFLADARADNAADFHISTSGAQPDLFITDYIVPEESNRPAIGYDLGQESVRRQALTAAVDNDRLTLSSRIVLVQDAEQQPGFLLLLPVYRPDAPIATRAQRWQNLLGWVGASIRVGDLLSGLVTYFNTPLDIEIFDGSNLAPELLLYDADGRLRSTTTTTPEITAEQEQHSRIELEVAGRTWHLDIYALPGFNQPIEHHMPEILLLGGGILSLLAALLVATYGKPLEQARILAEKMTRDLRESEQRFKSMFRNHNAVMLLVAPDDGRILDANPAASRFYGYSQQQLTTMTVDELNLMSHDEVAAVRQKIVAGEASSFELRHRLASGELRDVEVHSSPIEVAGGTALFSIIHNITPRKQALRALEENEQKYRALFDEAAHGAAVADREDGTVLACNRKLAQMVGRSVEEIVGQPQAMLHPAEALNAGQSRSFRFHRDHNPGLLVADQLLHKNGRRIDVEIKTSRLTLGGREVLQGVFYDISERTRAEKSLRESESRFRLLFESNPDPVLLFRFSSGDIIDVNRAFETATRITRLEALGHNAEELGLWADPTQRRHFWHLLRAEGAVNNFEGEFRIVGDGLRTGLFSARQLNLGHEPCVLATIRDITTEKAAERSLIEMDRIKSEFISTAAHELNTPLSAIMGYTELMRTPELFGGFDPRQQQDFLDEIYERGEALSRIVDDLLDISRIESGRPITLDLQPVDVRELLVKTCDYYRRHDLEHTFELQLPETAAAATLYIDRQRVNQVLENLLSNAVKYSPAGSTIRIGGRGGAQGWEVHVEDRGIGMTAEQVERVFDKFYRADASNTAVGGLGLGMSIAKQIIEEHGGQIRVESRPGEGTTVVFTLPADTDS